MRKSRFTEEQIIKVLKEHAAGLPAVDVCRKHGISDATFYKWRSRFGGSSSQHAPHRGQLFSAYRLGQGARRALPRTNGNRTCAS